MILYLPKKNKQLNAYGFINPIRIEKSEKDFLISQENKKFSSEELNKMSEEYKELSAGEVIKFEKEGDKLEGKYICYEESATYKNSYALKIQTTEGLKVVFVSSIVTDLINSNNIKKEQQIKLVYNGKIQNKAKTFEYKDYTLLAK